MSPILLFPILLWATIVCFLLVHDLVIGVTDLMKPIELHNDGISFYISDFTLVQQLSNHQPTSI